MRVSKLRKLSGANFDEDLCMISLEDEHYKGHIKVCELFRWFFSYYMLSPCFADSCDMLLTCANED
jgi:hypothetical protein